MSIQNLDYVTFAIFNLLLGVLKDFTVMFVYCTMVMLTHTRSVESFAPICSWKEMTVVLYITFNLYKKEIVIDRLCININIFHKCWGVYSFIMKANRTNDNVITIAKL